MSVRTTPVVLFVSAAGPELGFGHLVRVGRLAAALGVRRELLLAGDVSARHLALAQGWTIHEGRDVVGALSPDLVVIDDPSTARARRIAARARRLGIPTARVRRRSARADRRRPVDRWQPRVETARHQSSDGRAALRTARSGPRRF